jgi:hypothetical protein
MTTISMSKTESFIHVYLFRLTYRPLTRYRERTSTKGLWVKAIIKINYSAGSGLGALTC